MVDLRTSHTQTLNKKFKTNSKKYIRSYNIKLMKLKMIRMFCFLVAFWSFDLLTLMMSWLTKKQQQHWMIHTQHTLTNWNMCRCPRMFRLFFSEEMKN